MLRRRSVLVSASLLALLLALVLATVPVPYVLLVPGPVTNTLGKRSDGVPIITVTGHPVYPTAGQLDLTTVGVIGGPPGPLSLGRALFGWFSRQDAVVPEDLIYPPGQTQQDVEQINLQEMQQSQQSAVTAALRQLGIPVTVLVTVAGVVKGKPAYGVLRAGDVIRRVDGAAVVSSTQLRTLIGKRPVGSVVQLAIVRAGKPLTVSVQTTADPQRPGQPIIGITVGEQHRSPVNVKINLRNVGGPSAGLMFSLGIIDKLTPGDLNGGKNIAGTGTITDTGVVGPIGGIQQKIAAASAEGATYFLTPAGNCAAAASVRPGSLTLARVATLSQAMDALGAIRAGRAVSTC